MAAGNSPDTRRSLLLRIRDRGDDSAWSEFVRIYAPLIHAYSMRRGLQDADAADVAQQVLQSVARAIPGFEYDRAQGSFRGWLFTITRNHLISSVHKAARTPSATGDTAFHASLAERPDAADDEAEWNRDHERHLFRWAADKVEPEFNPTTWRVFWELSVNGRSTKEVADEAGISVGAAYVAKSRVLARLQHVIQSAEDY